MDKEDFSNTGLRLKYDENSRIPQIPYAQDVLYVMQLSNEEIHYSICLPRHASYVANTLLVAACVATEIIHPKAINRSDMFKAIARVIVSLCPEQARCLLVPGFAEAQRILGLAETKNRRPAELEHLCVCNHCRAQKACADTKNRAY